MSGATVQLNPGQKAAVTEHGHPCFILAGAGTGKTFTLSHRVAFEFDEGNADLLPDYGSLVPERMMAITFTEAAAAELTSRIRETAKKVSPEKARQIGAAWISTIHSACRRIIVQNAFEAEMDPGVVVLREDESEELLDAAVSDVLSSGQFPDAEPGVVKTLVRRAITTPGGVAAFDYGPAIQCASAQDCYKEAIRLGTEAKTVLSEKLATAGKPLSNNLAEYLADVEQKLAFLQVLVQSDIKPSTAYGQLKKFTNKRSGKPEEYTEFKNFIQSFKSDAEKLFQLPNLSNVVADVMDAYIKSLHKAGGVTFDSILYEAHILLSDDTVKHVTASSFDSIMVDEFQDTDQMQTAIIRALCSDGQKRPDGMNKLITVGDRQQSIYGFRGAQLSVSDEMAEQMKSVDANAEIKLNENFRSKEEILSFVEDVFEDDSMFGTDFLKLVPGTREQLATGSAPRVKMAKILNDRRSGTTVPAGDLEREKARLVAREIYEARQSGKIDSYDDVAILMRALTDAHIFMEELSWLGISSAITNGRRFYSFPEVSRVITALEAIMAPNDDFKLLLALVSGMFLVPDAELAAVKTRFCREKQTADIHLWQLGVTQEAKESWPNLHSAISVLAETRIRLCRGDDITETLGFLLHASGYEATLLADEMQGEGQWGNVRKLVDLAESVCRSDKTVPFQAVTWLLEASRDASEFGGRDNREKPGRVFGTGGEGTVSIMTIHSSKGLEFPFVVLACADSKNNDSGKVVTDICEDRVFVSLPIGKAEEREEACSKDEIQAAADYVEYASKIQANAALADAQEAKRLLYVALTRARDYLLYTGTTYIPKNSKDGLPCGDMLFIQVRDIITSKGTVSAPGCLDMGSYTVAYKTRICNEPIEPQVSDSILRAPATSRPQPQYGKFRTRVRRKTSFTELARLEHQHDEDVVELPLDDIDAVSPNENAPGGGHGILRRSGRNLGTAFHKLAEYSVQNGTYPPPDAVIAKTSRDNFLNAGQREELERMIAAWCGSPLRAQVLDGAECIWTETPIVLPFSLDDGEMEMDGIADLVTERCYDGRRVATVWDYKTGWLGVPDAEMAAHYTHQLELYAFALLSSGRYDEVATGIIRIGDDVRLIPGESYTSSGKDELESRLRQWISASLER